MLGARTMRARAIHQGTNKTQSCCLQLTASSVSDRREFVCQGGPVRSCKAFPYKTGRPAESEETGLPVAGPGDRRLQQFARVPELQFLFDPRAVGLDGLDGDMELASDVVRVQPAPRQFKHLELTIR